MKWLAGILIVAVCHGAFGQSDTTFFRLHASTTTVIRAMSRQGVITWSNATSGLTTGRVQKATTLLGQSNWVDYVAFSVTGSVTQLRLIDTNPPMNMAYIPGGRFTMGDTIGESGGLFLPAHVVNVSAFYMDKYEVTKALWDEVYTWATNNGYSFLVTGVGKAPNHPVVLVNWYSCIKWCNARSEKEGLVPAYYTSTNLTNVYRTGNTNLENSWVKWNAGYRLPTESEWEYAARGGLSGKRFPWGDTITHNQANYYSDQYFSYDISTTRGYHPTYFIGPYPCTSPVGSFAANGYGLCDMAGNVQEKLWDFYGDYSSGTQTDPRGPVLGLYRMFRGGSEEDPARENRVFDRGYYCTPISDSYDVGFRTVRGIGQ